MSEHIAHDHQHDGIDRRGFLRCMAWAGTGVVLGVVGDRVVTTALADAVQGQAAAPAAAFSFVQISDSHIGFHKAANKNVTGTFEEAVRRINALPQRPAFVMHTGDHVHLSTMGEFDTVRQIMSTIKSDRTFNVPGETTSRAGPKAKFMMLTCTTCWCNRTTAPPAAGALVGCAVGMPAIEWAMVWARLGCEPRAPLPTTRAALPPRTSTAPKSAIRRSRWYFFIWCPYFLSVL